MTGSTENGAAEGGSTSTQSSSLLRSLLVFVKEIVIVVALAVVLSLILKTWLVQTFWIPSASMMSTLVRDDRVLVSKLTPGPFELSRGDIVVFEDPGGWLDPTVAPPRQDGIGDAINSALTWVGLLPEDEGNHLIKRIIGMPGDQVTCCDPDGRILVNGQPIEEGYLHPGDTPSDVDFDVTVPTDRLWVLGDHRSDSLDSRFQDGEGDPDVARTVPVENVVGRAFAIVWPLNRLAWLGEPAGTFDGVPEAGQEPSPATTP